MGDQLLVEKASGPGPNAIHSLTEFEMDKEFTDAFIEREYADSEGMNVYIGEWHTHPEEFPRPSPQDWQSIGERCFEWAFGELAFVIIGFYGLTVETMPGQLIALMFDKSDEKLYRLPVEFTDV